jgi:hypothetical protein
MSLIPIITSSPDTIATASLPIAIAVPVLNISNIRNTCITDYLQAPLLPRSINHITMAPNNPDEWPYHYLKREIIELKKNS